MKITRNFATTLTTATFAVVAVSGLLMFFSIAKGGYIKLSHEWVGLAMVVAAGLHCVANWSAFKKYFEGKKLAVIAIIIVACGAWMMVPAKPNVAKMVSGQLYKKVMALPVKDACALLSCDAAALDELIAGAAGDGAAAGASTGAFDATTASANELIKSGVSEVELAKILSGKR